MKNDFFIPLLHGVATNKKYIIKPRLTILWFSILLFIYMLTVLPGSSGKADAETFPSATFNGMQIAYDISGASLEEPEDHDGFTVWRTHSGTLGTGTLQVQGTVVTRAASNNLSVTVQAGNETNSYQETIIYEAGGAFNISVPIPVDATSGSFSINLTGHYGNGETRGVEVTGTLTVQNHPPEVSLSYEPVRPIAGIPITFTANVYDPDLDIVSYEWFLNGHQQTDAKSDTVVWSNPSIGTHSLKVVVSDGRGGVEEDSVAFTVIAKPYVIAPGFQEGEGSAWGFVDKVFIDGSEISDGEQQLLYTGSRVKTGPGVEILLRTPTGAVVRVCENSDYEVQVRKFATTSMITIYGRLIKGIGEFYWPKGYEGAQKFEVDTRRAITSIKGTTFTVAHLNGVTTVSVQEGVVEVTNRDTGAVSLVQAGESLVVGAEINLEGPYLLLLREP